MSVRPTIRAEFRMEFVPGEKRTLDIGIFQNDEGQWYAKATDIYITFVKDGRRMLPKTRARDIISPVLTNTVADVCAELIDRWIRMVYAEIEGSKD